MDEKKPPVTFKGKKNGISVFLEPGETYDALKSAFAQKAEEAKPFFVNSNFSVSFSGFTLSRAQKEELTAVLKEKTEAVVTIDGKAAAAAKEQAPPSQKTYETVFHSGSLRSGQSIIQTGSVVVLGDCNPGSEICATGNIIILGSLKGFAHAGSMGDLTCYIAALNMMPAQIRIGDIITYIPKEIKSNVRQTTPSYAYIDGGRIYIAKM